MKKKYYSPIGEMLIVSDSKHLIGLFFIGQKYYLRNIDSIYLEDGEDNIIRETVEWLEEYFKGKNPTFDIPIRVEGMSFFKEVIEELRKIPYGTLTTYGNIAKSISNKHGGKKISARAVGGAVGKNPISIIIPCHRVIGTNGSITGYAGGTDKKKLLLKCEGIDFS